MRLPVRCLQGLCAHGDVRGGGDGGSERVVDGAGSSRIEHLGLAHDEAGGALKAVAAQRLAAGQAQLNLG
jgi:hypothetical protein